jgi:hypothetical protein
MRKMAEDACWICRRTKEEIVAQAEKDGMLDYIDEEMALESIGDMYDCDYRKSVCATCKRLIERTAEDLIKALIDDDRLTVKFER